MDPDDEIIILTYAYRKRDIPFLYTASFRPSYLTEAKAPKDISEVYAFTIILLELAHTRLGHVSQPTIRVNHYRISNEVEGDSKFDYELYRITRLRKIIHHNPRERTKKLW
jgi:hypothetical protein